MKKRILFMGRKDVGAKCLQYLLDREDVIIIGVITDYHLSISPTSDIANKHKIPLFTFDQMLTNLKSGSVNFDLGFSMLYWRKLRDEYLSIPGLGIINFHPAILPEYKGTAGYNLAILNGLSEWGVSAHYINESIDTGNLIEVHKFKIDLEKETVKSLEATCQKKLLDQFIRISDAAISAEHLLPTQANTGGQYISRIQMEAMKEIKEGDNIDRKIRAFWYPPYDGAYAIINGKKFTLVNRQILESLADSSTSNLFTPKNEQP